MLQENPEGHVRSMDVETGPDADTPRPCGLALLLCMIERSRTTAETALVGYASRLQVSSTRAYSKCNLLTGSSSGMRCPPAARLRH